MAEIINNKTGPRSLGRDHRGSRSLVFYSDADSVCVPGSASGDDGGNWDSCDSISEFAIRLTPIPSPH